MSKLLFTISFSLLSISAFSQWNLVWSDEFDSAALDMSKWSHETGGNGWGNNESQFYTTNGTNLQVSNDELKIIALQETIGNNPYTSAKIVTKGKYQIQYGKIEARIKIPMGQGTWPAFWMLGSNIDQVSWPFCGEIDIVEHINSELMTHGTAHWDVNGYAYYGNSVANSDPTQFHIYSIEWDDAEIKWFFNGNQYHTMNIDNGINGTNEFQEPFYLILNLAVGGNWPGYPDATTTFPQVLVVDYVRVYKDQSDLGLDAKELKSLSIYPNPGADELRIEGAKINDLVSFKTMDGKTCLSQKISHQNSFNVSPLDSGAYFVELKNEKGAISRAKFVKK